MKHFLPLLALFVVPQLALAQPTPIQHFCKSLKQPLPNGEDLLSHLFDAYDGAKTFSGTFEMNARYMQNEKLVLQQTYKMDAAWRCNEQGDKERDYLRLQNVVNHNDKDRKQTVEWFDNGKNVAALFVDQNVWQSGKHVAPTAFSQLLKPIVQGLALSISSGVQQSSIARFQVERGREGGRDVFIVRSKPDAAFRVVVDAQSRALRTLTYSSQGLTLFLHGSNQVFDFPIADSMFEMKTSPGAREVQSGEVQLLELFALQFDPNKR